MCGFALMYARPSTASWIEDDGEEEDTAAAEAEDAGVGSYTEEEVAKVRRALTIRLESRARSSRPLPNPPLLGERHYKPYFEQSEQISWSGDLRGFYRKLYLGPVPHAVAALDGALEHLRKLKRTATKRLVDKNGDHRELDDIQADIKRWK